MHVLALPCVLAISILSASTIYSNIGCVGFESNTLVVGTLAPEESRNRRCGTNKQDKHKEQSSTVCEAVLPVTLAGVFCSTNFVRANVTRYKIWRMADRRQVSAHRSV